jgi:EF-hand domain
VHACPRACVWCSLEAAFGALDVDGNGVITLAELEGAMLKLGVFDALTKDQVILPQ